jgi:hypothetical protein
VTLQERIRAAVRQRESGDIEDARLALASLRLEIEKATTFDQLFFAHSFADVQADLDDEIHWDCAALELCEQLTEQEAEAEGIPGGKADLLPSLHLNLADGYRRRGDEATALAHHQAGLRHLDALDGGQYGPAIRAAFARFEAQT